MSKFFDGGALLEVAGIALVATVAMVLLFSLGTLGLNAAHADDDNATPAQRLGGRAGAGAAFAACGTLVVLAVVVMLNK